MHHQGGREALEEALKDKETVAEACHLMPKPANTPKPARRSEPRKPEPNALTGWNQIAASLGEPTSVVQRWASEGMPVRRQGRFVTTTPEELNAWLGRESGKPVHVAKAGTDLTTELKRGLSFVRHEKRAPAPTKKER